MKTTRGRHTASPAERRRHRAVPTLRLRARALVLAAASTLLAVVLATTAASGTYALLNSSAATSSATIASGTATMTVSALALPAVLLYPGLVIAAPVTVTNTGDVPLAVTRSSLLAPAVSSTLSDSLTIGLAVVDSSAACTSAVIPSTSGTFASAPSTAVGLTLAKAQSRTVCVLIALPAGAPSVSQSSSAANFSVVLTGVQA